MGLGLSQILVGRLEKPEGWVCQIWDVLSWRIQTNKQLEQKQFFFSHKSTVSAEVEPSQTFLGQG